MVVGNRCDSFFQNDSFFVERTSFKSGLGKLSKAMTIKVPDQSVPCVPICGVWKRLEVSRTGTSSLTIGVR